MSGGEKMVFERKTQPLAYCHTCKILRPPRSFHCSRCNCCMEIHDHHCPWVGTCVARRNHRYFTLFLLSTAVHSLHTFILGLISMAVVGVFSLDDPQHKDPYHTSRVIAVIYSGLFSLTLGGFYIFQTSLILRNITSNEHLRQRWNANPERRNTLRLITPPILDRFKYFYFSELPKSKVEALFEQDSESLLIDNRAILKDYGIEV